MHSMPVPMLVIIFVGAAIAVWWAGVRLTDATEVLDQGLNLSDALGGMLLLTIGAALPEIAITVAAVMEGRTGVAVGNLLGGIAIHAVVLVVLDIAGTGKNPPLSNRTRTLVPVLQGLWVIGALALVVMGSQLQPLAIGRIEPIALVVAAVWIAGVILIQRASERATWTPEDTEAGEPKTPEKRSVSMRRAGVMFGGAAVITLVAGVLLERSGSAIASHLGMDGLVFGATILAVAAAIPEVSTGVEAVKRGDHQLAVSDIFGINAFFLSLLLVIGVISGQAVIATMSPASVYLAVLAVILTLINIIGMLMRSDRIAMRMGIDSMLVLVLYVCGVVGLVLVG